MRYIILVAVLGFVSLVAYGKHNCQTMYNELDKMSVEATQDREQLEERYFMFQCK